MKTSKQSKMSSLTSTAQNKVTNYVIGGLSNNNGMIPQDMKAEGMANLNNKVEAKKVIDSSNQNTMS